MNGIAKAAIKNALLQNLYDRVTKGKGAKDVTATALRRQTPEAKSVSTNYVSVLLDSLISAGYVRQEDYSRYSITEEGIELVESGWTFREAPHEIVDAWDEPDGKLTLSVSAIQTVQTHLRQCIILIDASAFSQEEKAQIRGLLRICDQIVELPTPKLGLLKRILGWLKEIKDLLPLIEAILRLIGKS